MSVGGFDAVRFDKPSVEDIELGYRLKQRGSRIRLDRDIQIKHLKKWTAASILRTDFFCRAIPWSRLVHEHDAMTHDLNLRVESRISVALSGLLAGSLILSVLSPKALVFAAAAAAGLLVLNLPLYRFFLKVRGPLFMALAIPWHWLYFLYSGVAYVLGTTAYRIDALNRRTEDAEAA
jgi:hypothetical protein